MADSLIFISIMFITLLACDWISNLAGSMRNCVPVIPSCKLTKSTPPPPRICQAFLSPRYSANKAAEQSIDCSGTIFDGFGDSALKRVVRAFLADVDFGSTLRSQHIIPYPMIIHNLRVHDLRHISATDLYEAGNPEREIMDIAGWLTPMLSRYRHKNSLRSAQKIVFKRQETIIPFVKQENYYQPTISCSNC